MLVRKETWRKRNCNWSRGSELSLRSSVLKQVRRRTLTSKRKLLGSFSVLYQELIQKDWIVSNAKVEALFLSTNKQLINTHKQRLWASLRTKIFLTFYKEWVYSQNSKLLWSMIWLCNANKRLTSSFFLIW